MRNKNSCNKYDCFLIFLIASLAFGGLGGDLQLSRLLGIILTPMMIVRIKQCKYVSWFLVTFVLFYCYALLSMVWTPDKMQGGKELVYFLVHFMIFFEILVFSHFAKDPLKSISTGWIVAVGLTLIVAMWELITDNHLSISKSESGLISNFGNGFILEHRFAAVTFYNYNSYVTFLSFSMPFIFYKIRSGNSRNIILKNVPIVILLLSIGCILYNGSRGGLISTLIMVVIFFMMGRKNLVKSFQFIVFVLLAIVFVIYFGENMLQIIIARSVDGGLTNGNSRFVIWKSVLNAVLYTIGLGTGIGGRDTVMRTFTNGITAPHNLFLEILLEFGVLFLCIFLLFLFDLYKKAKRLTDRDRKILLYMALFAMPVYCIINSGYLLNSYVYAAFASLIVFAKYEHIKSIY